MKSNSNEIMTEKIRKLTEKNKIPFDREPFLKSDDDKWGSIQTKIIEIQLQSIELQRLELACAFTNQLRNEFNDMRQNDNFQNNCTFYFLPILEVVIYTVNNNNSNSNSNTAGSLEWVLAYRTIHCMAGQEDIATIDSLIQSGKRITERNSHKWVTQIFESTQYLHDRFVTLGQVGNKTIALIAMEVISKAFDIIKYIFKKNGAKGISSLIEDLLSLFVLLVKLFFPGQTTLTSSRCHSHGTSKHPKRLAW